MSYAHKVHKSKSPHNQTNDGENFDENDIEALLCELEYGKDNSIVQRSDKTDKHTDVVRSKTSCPFSTYASDEAKTVRSAQSGVDASLMASDSVKRLYSRPCPRVLAGGQRLAPIKHDESNKKHDSEEKKDHSRVSQHSVAGVQEMLALATRQVGHHGDLTGQPEIGVAAYHHFNFLPVMHAEKLEKDHHLTGILPRARWGHTLVTIEDNGSSAYNISAGAPATGSVASLLLFGGTVTMEKAVNGDEGETNDLFEFRIATRSWEPLYIKGSSYLDADPMTSANRKARGNQHHSGSLLHPSSVSMSHHSNLPKSIIPPARRTMHSGVAYQNRYLLVFGGTADHGTTLYNDVHSYDMVTRQWCHLGAESYNHEPSGRFGHSAVVYSNLMFIFGGKCARREDGADELLGTSKNTHLSNDVHIFDLSTNTWRKRVGLSHVSDKKSSKNKATSSVTGEDKERGSTATVSAEAVGPCRRFHHAATVLGGDMYIHGGEASDGTILSDTWAFNFERKDWRLVHCDGGINIPRSRHFLYGCGEALLALGGISHVHQQRCFKDSSLAVLPVLERITMDEEGDVLCPISQEEMQWISVTVSNTEAITFSKKNFGATAQGGFIYTFGGLNSPTEAANNSLVRCLAMDGVPLPAESLQINTIKTPKGTCYPVRSLRESGLALLSKRMSRMLEDTSFFDIYLALPSSHGTMNDCCFGAHHLILLLRAPHLYEKILQCPQVAIGQSPGEIAIDSTLATFVSSREGSSEKQNTNNNSDKLSIPCYNIACRSNRAQGLKVELTQEALKSLLYFLYTGSVVTTMDIRNKKENCDDDDVSQGSTDAVLDMLEEVSKEYQIISLSIAVRGRRRNKCNKHTDEGLLPPQSAESESLNKDSKTIDYSSFGVGRVKRRSPSQSTDRTIHSQIFGETNRLSDDLAALLESGTHSTATVLFIDPHTKVQSTRVVHPLILANSSNVFLNLLRPLLSTDKEVRTPSTSANITNTASTGIISNTFAGITAKKKVGNTAQTNSTQHVFNKRSIIIGPVHIPTMSIDSVLSYLYTASLNIHHEAALATLMGAQTLGLFDLQAHCESIVAREEVNYESCLSYLLLAEKHGATLLKELSLLTAALGLDEAIGIDAPAYDGNPATPQRQIRGVGGAGYSSSENIHDSPQQGTSVGPNSIGGTAVCITTLRNSSAFNNMSVKYKEKIDKIAKALKGKWTAPQSPEHTHMSGLADQRSPEHYVAPGRKW